MKIPSKVLNEVHEENKMKKPAKLLSSKTMIGKNQTIIQYKDEIGRFRRITLIKKWRVNKRKSGRDDAFLYQFIGKSGFPSTKWVVLEFPPKGIETKAKELFDYT